MRCHTRITETLESGSVKTESIRLTSKLTHKSMPLKEIFSEELFTVKDFWPTFYPSSLDDKFSLTTTVNQIAFSFAGLSCIITCFHLSCTYPFSNRLDMSSV